MLGEDESGRDALESDGERFEFARYIVNTAPDVRTKISESDAAAALDWMRRQD
ncbi:hypothetical protein YM304_40920 [Ilumatobacter coccineus YM16-304]|uniref:Uncharacterized protein n=1 Tax=Ilumatobacter coccineus (strain NBRC 103263 / KCTC 29153 / YM16-304) TaxID=1313172 RepID=A0A6C7EKD0_ILUCY|nr:hypothetical protein YM304_40920 [Ilumatobacter coccineus YM16-304]